MDLNVTFYRELFRFYRENKGSIRSHYRGLTRTLLDYNDPDRPRPGQFLRRPQFEALEIYVFLKEFLKLRPVHDICADWYNREKGFEKRGVCWVLISLPWMNPLCSMKKPILPCSSA